MKARCICGCGKRAVARHHVVYEQHLPTGKVRCDPRNYVRVAFDCHGAHHNRSRPLWLALLPDSVFEFAAEILGREKAYNYLARRYNGRDPRLDALLEDVAA